MDFGKLFKSVEDAVYEVMVWILLLPKTLFLSMFKPKQTMEYLEGEWEKKPDDRFDEYLSPVLLWLIVAVIPISLVVIFSGDITNINITKELSEKMLPITLYSMIVPFTYIVWMEWINKRPVKKSTLKLSFYRHCYALAPSQILTAITAGLTVIFWPFIFAAIVMLPIYEAFVFQKELEITYKKAFGYAMVPQTVLLVVFFVVILSM